MLRVLLPLLAALLLEETDPDPPPDDEEIRDPEKKALSDEAAKWRRKYRDAEGRIRELEEATPPNEDLQAARLESAFLREVISREEKITDLETAWDLAHVRGYFDALTGNEDGEIDGMSEALDRLVDRYPYLLDEEAAPERPTLPSGRHPKKPPANTPPDAARFRKRFPALRSR